MFVQKLLDLAFSQGAGKTVYRLAIDHQDAGRNAADAKGCAKLLLLVRVDFDELEASGIGGFDFLQNRPQRLARAAPGRPEVKQHGRQHGSGDDFLFKVGNSNVNHDFFEKWVSKAKLQAGEG